MLSAKDSKMRIILILIIGFVSIETSLCQDKMIVDQPDNGTRVYGEFSEHIDSLSELPKTIRLNINGYIDLILGNMSDSLTFSHGQIVDLESKFNEDSTVYRYEWIVPKYDLSFVLRDESIGINSYYLKIELDRYGQVVSCNWPRKKYSDKNQFLSRYDIETYTLLQAKEKGFITDEYVVDLKYRKQLDKLCWIFKFPKSMEKDNREYNVIEISWNELKIIDEYGLMVGTSR